MKQEKLFESNESIYSLTHHDSLSQNFFFSKLCNIELISCFGACQKKSKTKFLKNSFLVFTFLFQIKNQMNSLYTVFGSRRPHCKWTIFLEFQKCNECWILHSTFILSFFRVPCRRILQTFPPLWHFCWCYVAMFNGRKCQSGFTHSAALTLYFWWHSVKRIWKRTEATFHWVTK